MPFLTSTSIKLTLFALFCFNPSGCTRKEELPRGVPLPPGAQLHRPALLSELPPRTTLIGTTFRVPLRTSQEYENVSALFHSSMTLRLGGHTYHLTSIEVDGRSYGPDDLIPLFNIPVKQLPTDIIWNDGVTVTADHTEKGRIDITIKQFLSILESLHRARTDSVCVSGIRVQTTVQGLPFFDAREGTCTITFAKQVSAGGL